MSNYVQEGKVKDALADAGVREIELDTFIDEYRAGSFSIGDMTPEWFEAKRKALPHRFIGGVSEDELLYLLAFGPLPNLTAQGRVVAACNGNVDEANAIAARFGGRVGSTKPGTDPNKDTDTKGKTANPFEDGTPGGEARRVSAIRSLGTKAAASLAASCGRDIAGRPLRKRA